jgi:hypothetical protein
MRRRGDCDLVDSAPWCSCWSSEVLRVFDHKSHRRLERLPCQEREVSNDVPLNYGEDYSNRTDIKTTFIVLEPYLMLDLS